MRPALIQWIVQKKDKDPCGFQSGREAVRLYMMALSGSTRERHFDLEQCLRFLESKNSEKHGLRLNPAVSRYQKFVINGPDSFLLLFQRSLRSHDVKKVLIYLRNFEILDETDCERISCESISDLMVTELVTMIRTKDPHAFWYFTHSLKKNALFQFFHGGIHCCVCEEVRAKEKEIDETVVKVLVCEEGRAKEIDETVFKGLEKISTTIKKAQNILGKTKQDLERTKRAIQSTVSVFRQVVSPPIRELKTAVKIFLEKAMENNDKCKEKMDEQSQQQPEVKIAIQDEEPAKLEEGVEDGNETVFQDDEAGHMMEQSKAKPKVTVSVPTFDYVEGRKKYIAFVIVSIFTLYSYVDSVIKIIPF